MEKKHHSLGKNNAKKKKKEGMDSKPVFQPNMILYAINAPVCAIYLVTKPQFVIGHAADCDAVLQFSREISRHHACISWKDGIYEIEDLGSTNHTFLNGSVLTPNHPQVLQKGDHVSFASFVFEIKIVRL